MKLAFASDFHGSPKHFSAFFDLAREQQADAAIVGGDLFPVSRPYEAMLRDQKDFALNTLPGILENHRSAGGCPVYLVPGNNDWQSAFAELAGSRQEGLVAIAGAATQALPSDYALVALPYVPPTPFRQHDFNRRDLMADPAPQQPNPVYYSQGDRVLPIDIGELLSGRSSIEEELANLGLGALDARRTIYVMHSPPFQTGLDRMVGGLDVGSKAIRWAIEKHQPLLTLHGHIHEAPMICGRFACRLGRTVAVNAGQAWERLQAVIVDIGGEVSLWHTAFGTLDLSGRG